MNAKKLNEIANWLEDRIIAGRNEENGSMDWTNFGKTEMTIVKEDGYFLVYLNNDFIPEWELTDSMTFDEIMSEIATA